MVSPTISNRVLFTALLPSLLAAAWLVSKAKFYWERRPEMHFGWIVVLLCAFMIWDAWPKRPQARFQSVAIPMLLVLPALVMIFLFQVYQAALGMNAASLLLLAAGLMLIIFANIHWVFGIAGLRHFAFATLFFLIALPIPTAIYGPVVGALQSFVVAIDLNVLSILGVPAQRSGNLIQLPSGIVGVNEACSGIRSAQSTIMSTLFIGHLVLRNRSLKFWLLVAGLGFAILGNVIRSVYLCLRADAGGSHAVEAAHDAAGWSILIFTTAGVIFTAWVFARLDRKIIEVRNRSLPQAAPAPNA